jgi:hypothetical protein
MEEVRAWVLKLEGDVKVFAFGSPFLLRGAAPAAAAAAAATAPSGCVPCFIFILVVVIVVVVVVVSEFVVFLHCSREWNPTPSVATLVVAIAVIVAQRWSRHCSVIRHIECACFSLRSRSHFKRVVVVPIVVAAAAAGAAALSLGAHFIISDNTSPL